MADGSHRLAVNQAMGAAEAGEAARREAHMPDSAHGGDPGVSLDDLTAADCAALGLSTDAVVPVVDPLDQPDDYRD